jgi:hypothetical protein
MEFRFGHADEHTGIENFVRHVPASFENLRGKEGIQSQDSATNIRRGM